MAMPSPDKQLTRSFLYNYLRRNNMSLSDYLRPFVEAGRSRAEILGDFTKAGFFDEEVEGALIDLDARERGLP